MVVVTSCAGAGGRRSAGSEKLGNRAASAVHRHGHGHRHRHTPPGRRPLRSQNWSLRICEGHLNEHHARTPAEGPHWHRSTQASPSKVGDQVRIDQGTKREREREGHSGDKERRVPEMFCLFALVLRLTEAYTSRGLDRPSVRLSTLSEHRVSFTLLPTQNPV